VSQESTAIPGFRRFLVKPLEVLLILAMAAMTVDVLWGVFSRYVLGAQTRWTEELAIYLLIWISLLGASLTYGVRGHLGVDYFVGKLDPGARRLSAFFVELFVMLFAGIGLVYGGWILVTRTLAAGQVAPTLGWQMGYVYLAAPVSGVFFLLFAIEHLIGLVRGSSEDRQPEDPAQDG
jgi:TRAP-type C4-dicarboxylate transport system permease small subunit